MHFIMYSIFIEIMLVYKLSMGKSGLYEAEISYSRTWHVFQYDHIQFFVLREHEGGGVD